MGSEQCGETADCDGGGEGRGGRRLKIPRACECTPLPSSRSSSLPSFPIFIIYTNQSGFFIVELLQCSMVNSCSGKQKRMKEEMKEENLKCYG